MTVTVTVVTVTMVTLTTATVVTVTAVTATVVIVTELAAVTVGTVFLDFGSLEFTKVTILYQCGLCSAVKDTKGNREYGKLVSAPSSLLLCGSN
jgi:hypothetical protein